VAGVPGNSDSHGAGEALVYLARHGQTAYNREGRFQGHLPVPLDETGRAQARELARRAAGHAFAALWSSPLVRARETAQVISRRIGLPAREDPRLAETDAGDWTDRTFEEVRLEAPERFAGFVGGDPGFSFPGGESFAQHGERVAAALADVERGPLPALVVCHGVVIRIALVQRAGNRGPLAKAVPNGVLIPLPPAHR
jgi:broad specificity phosphatase PhoE